MRAHNVVFICLSIFYQSSAFAVVFFDCSPFIKVGTGISDILSGAAPLERYSKALTFLGTIEDGDASFLNTSSLEARLSFPDSFRYRMFKVAQTTKLLTPLTFYKTNGPRFHNRDGLQITGDVSIAPTTNLVAVVAEKYAILLPETGAAISLCREVKFRNLPESEPDHEVGLSRLQKAMVQSELLREVLPEQFDALSKPFFPHLQNLLGVAGLYDSNGSFIYGVDARVVGTALVATATSIQLLRMLATGLTKNPALAAIVLPMPDTHGISIDVNKLGLTSAQLTEFLNQNGNIQRARCQQDSSVKKLCEALRQIEFEISYARGEGA